MRWRRKQNRFRFPNWKRYWPGRKRSIFAKTPHNAQQADAKNGQDCRESRVPGAPQHIGRNLVEAADRQEKAETLPVLSPARTAPSLPKMPRTDRWQWQLRQPQAHRPARKTGSEPHSGYQTRPVQHIRFPWLVHGFSLLFKLFLKQDNASGTIRKTN